MYHFFQNTLDIYSIYYCFILFSFSDNVHLLVSPALLSILVLPILSWFFLTTIIFCTPTSAPLFNYLLFIFQVLLKASLALG